MWQSFRAIGWGSSEGTWRKKKKHHEHFIRPPVTTVHGRPNMCGYSVVFSMNRSRFYFPQWRCLICQWNARYDAAVSIDSSFILIIDYFINRLIDYNWLIVAALLSSRVVSSCPLIVDPQRLRGWSRNPVMTTTMTTNRRTMWIHDIVVDDVLTTDVVTVIDVGKRVPPPPRHRPRRRRCQASAAAGESATQAGIIRLEAVTVDDAGSDNRPWNWTPRPPWISQSNPRFHADKYQND